MGRIVEKVRIIGKKGSGVYDAVIDTGADRTLISQKVADKIGPIVHSDFKIKTLYSFDGHKIDSKEGSVLLSIKNCSELSADCRIVEKLEQEQIIIGHDFLQRNKAYIDMKNDKLILSCPKHWMV